MTIGLTVRRGERQFQLERQVDEDTLVFIDQLTGRTWTTSPRELWSALQNGTTTLLHAPETPLSAASKKHPTQIFNWDSIPRKYQTKITRQLAYINEALRLGISRGQRRQLAAIIKRVQTKTSDRRAPSTSALMEWFRRYDEGGRTPAALLDKHAFHASNPRLDNSVIEHARKLLRIHYCTRKRPALSETVDLINRQLSGDPAKIVPPENRVISYATVRRLRDEIDAYRLDESRHGAAYARNRYRYAANGVVCERAQQRYEIDHTLLDVVVICDRTGLPLGRPTLTLIVDSYSGYIVSFFISFWGTGLAPTFGAMRLAFSPKLDYRSMVPGLQNRWHGMGIPETLVVDNGLEFHSPQLLSVGAHLNMNVVFNKVRQPWLKPFVERAIGSLTRKLPHAGLVQKGLTNEIPLDPCETAAITFSDLAKGLLIACVDEHAMQINQRTLSRPIDLFCDSLERIPPSALPVPSQELDIIVAPSKAMTVNHEGVVYQYLRYNSPELHQLRKRIGTSFKTTVKFDANDMGHIWLQDPSTQGWLDIPSCDHEYTENLSMIQHRSIRAFNKERHRAKRNVESLMQAKQALIDHWDASIKRGKRLKGDHLRALATVTSSQSLLGQTPLTVDPVKILNRPTTDTSQDEVPGFDAFEMGGEDER